MEAKEKLMHILMLVAAGEYMGELNWSKQADKIIEAFPQIEKKPVPIYKTDDEICVLLDKRFAKENERTQWLDSHYVEEVK